MTARADTGRADTAPTVGPGPAQGNLAVARAFARALVGGDLATAEGTNADGGADVFVSPGSRSTALVIAFDELAATHEDVRLHVVLDERVAGFAALGASRATRRPAILLCTSGSAGGHYLPAIMEAHRSRVPLIVVTADRPPELHHCGAPQTVEQSGMFAGYVRWSVTLATPNETLSPRDLAWARAMAQRARIEALGHQSAGLSPGPVHVNAPFRKPLLDGRGGGDAPAGRVTLGQTTLASGDVESLLARLTAVGDRGIVFCGPKIPATLHDSALRDAVLTLARRLGWPVIADGVSGVRCHDPQVVHHGEALARAGVCPDATFVLRIGGAPTNKALATWLSTIDDGLAIDPGGHHLDPACAFGDLVVADPVAVSSLVADRLMPRSGPSSWVMRWRSLDDRAATLLDAFDAPASGIVAARALTSSLTAEHRLHVASSMAIRDFDATARPDGVTVTHNRGVNGIDGTVATAMGIAEATGDRTAVLLGDLALLHDISGVTAAANTPLCIVVVNNDGGGIFEMLPVANELDEGRFERLFATPPRANIGALVTAAGATHVALSEPDQATLGAAVTAALAAPGMTVVEVVQSRPRETDARQRMWTAVTSGLQAATFEEAGASETEDKS